MFIGIAIADLFPQVSLDGVVAGFFAVVAIVVIVVAPLHPPGQLLGGQAVGKGLGELGTVSIIRAADIFLGAKIHGGKVPACGFGGLRNSGAVGGKFLLIAGGVLAEVQVQDQGVARLQRVILVLRVGMVKVDAGVHRGDLGFQLRVGRKLLIHAVHDLLLQAILGGAVVNAQPLPGHRHKSRRAHYDQDERAAQNAQPIELELYVGLGAVDQHLDAQHDEDDRREF